MKIENIKTSDLIPYARNAKKHDAAQVSKLAGSIREFGFNNPVLIDKDNGIIAGHGRVMAAQSLSLETVPCIRLGHLSDTQRRAYILADNRLAEIGGGWDEEMLKLELADLAALDIDVTEIGFGAEDLADLDMEDEPETSDADAEPQIDKAEELRTKWGVEHGQLWELGDHRLLCGDSTKKDDVERVMGGEKLQAVVTDPPYGMAFQSNYRKIQHEAISGDGDEDLLMLAIGLEVSHSKYIWCRWDNIPKLPKPKSVITWAKNNWSMGDLEHEHARQTEVCLFYAGPHHRWVGNRPTDLVSHSRTGNPLHPTQKPASLIAEVIGWTAGDIYEPFSGSGTTIIACEQLGRKCRAIEISPAYVAVAIQRWADATGKEPKRLA